MHEEKRKQCFSGLIETLEKRKQHDIARLQAELAHCRSVLKALKKVSTQGMSKVQSAHHQNRIYLEQRRKVVLVNKLKALGVMVEKRGRPKKEPEKTYKQTHVKFTAMLKPENLDFLKKLKKQGDIVNISAFLDELVEKHRQSMVDSSMGNPND